MNENHEFDARIQMARRGSYVRSKPMPRNVWRSYRHSVYIWVLCAFAISAGPGVSADKGPLPFGEFKWLPGITLEPEKKHGSHNDGTRLLYNEVSIDVGGTSYSFRLVPRNAPSDREPALSHSVESYYVSIRPMSLRQFNKIRERINDERVRNKEQLFAQGWFDTNANSRKLDWLKDESTPATTVTFDDAKIAASYLRGRLPTESQWKKFSGIYNSGKPVVDVEWPAIQEWTDDGRPLRKDVGNDGPIGFRVVLGVNDVARGEFRDHAWDALKGEGHSNNAPQLERWPYVVLQLSPLKAIVGFCIFAGLTGYGIGRVVQARIMRRYASQGILPPATAQRAWWPQPVSVVVGVVGLAAMSIWMLQPPGRQGLDSQGLTLPTTPTSEKTVAPDEKTVAPDEKTVAPDEKTVAPDGFRRVGNERREVGGRLYASVIEWKESVDAGRALLRPRFVLIVPEKDVGLEPFWIMDTKAWNGFLAYTYQKRKGNANIAEAWREKGPAGRVATHISVADAIEVAKLWGGRLPTVAEWDWTIGCRGADAKSLLPVKGRPWINEKDYRSVTATDCDETAEGVKDMFGNVREWTAPMKKSKAGGGQDFDTRPDDKLMVTVRGRHFKGEDPLSVLAFKAEQSKPNVVEAGRTDKSIGFRIVIPINR